MASAGWRTTDRIDVLICNDDMVGHFAMDRIEVDRETDKALIDYVNTKCFGKLLPR